MFCIRRIADSPDFKSGLERLLNGIEKFRVALMCSEENPMNCHRRLLVGRVLSNAGVEVLHIRADGSIQSEEQILSDQYKRNGDVNQQSLFVSEEPSEWKSTQSVLRRKAPRQFFGALSKAGIRRLIDIRLNNSSQLAGFTKQDDLAFFLREICRAEYTHQSHPRSNERNPRWL